MTDEQRGLIRDLTTCLHNRNAEIAGLRAALADAREVLSGMDEIVARLHREKEILAIAIQMQGREKAALVEALTDLDEVLGFDDEFEAGSGYQFWEPECTKFNQACAKARAALRSATETKEPNHGK
jgi:hypothetical protein